MRIRVDTEHHLGSSRHSEAYPIGEPQHLCVIRTLSAVCALLFDDDNNDDDDNNNNNNSMEELDT